MTEDVFHPSVRHILDLFGYAHLPPHLAAISQPIHELAYALASELGGNGPELTVGLRKLLEAKDALVRQAVINAR